MRFCSFISGGFPELLYDPSIFIISNYSFFGLCIGTLEVAVMFVTVAVAVAVVVSGNHGNQ